MSNRSSPFRQCYRLVCTLTTWEYLKFVGSNSFPLLLKSTYLNYMWNCIDIINIDRPNRVDHVPIRAHENLSRTFLSCHSHSTCRQGSVLILPMILVPSCLESRVRKIQPHTPYCPLMTFVVWLY
jgi:hypothetical protein